MYAINKNGTWNDNTCNKPLPAICEKGKIYGTYMWHTCNVYIYMCSLCKTFHVKSFVLFCVFEFKKVVIAEVFYAVFDFLRRKWSFGALQQTYHVFKRF